MVQGLSGKKRLLVSFHYSCENYLTLNQLTVMKIEKSPMEEEPKVLTIAVITDETVPF